MRWILIPCVELHEINQTCEQTRKRDKQVNDEQVNEQNKQTLCVKKQVLKKCVNKQIMINTVVK